MKIILAKYGVETTIPFSLFEVDGVDFRVDAVHTSGDTFLTRNEAAEANTTNGFVDEGTGYSLVLTATEMQTARIHLFIVDQTATKVWLDTDIVIMTFGHASAQFETFPADVVSVAGTAQTANDNGADINEILLDTAEIGVAGAGLTNIDLPNQTMDITGSITGNLSGSVGSVTGAVGSVTAAVTTDSASRTASQADVSDIPNNAELSARTILAADYFDPAVDEVITDSASRIASQADVSALATEATLIARTLLAAGYFDPANDQVSLNRILTTLITETNSGDLANSLSFFYDVSPTTTKTVNDVGVAGAGLTAQQVWEYVTRTLTGTVTTDTASRDASKADVSNLDVAVSTRSSHSAASIWAVGTRTLTSFGTLIADIWSNVSRTITGGSVTADNMRGTDSVPINPLLTNDVRLDNLDASIAAIPTTPMRGTDGANTVVPDVAGTAATPAEVNAQVLDVLTVDTFPEPGQETPPATASILTKISYGYKVWRNRKTVNATTESLYNDDGVTLGQQRTVSDDLTTGEKGEVTSG